MKTPTINQATRLRVLADGYAILAPKRGDWVGLLRAGWVERIDQTTPRGGLLPPLRITEAGRVALALTKPEEGECSETTSVRPSLSVVASGGRLPRLRSLGSGNPLPARGWTRPNCSSGSRLARLTCPQPPQCAPLPSSEAVAEIVEEIWRGLDARAARREPGGYNAAHRCWSCRRFVSGAHATCGHCGQRHGGINHDAYAAR